MINWNPSAGDEVAQRVRTLLRTAPGSVPLARTLGTPQDVVDSPQSVAGARLTAAVVRALRTWEPKVTVQRVTLATDQDGRLTAIVEIP